MAIIAIYLDTRRKGQCRRCGAAIEWADTVRGPHMPFDGAIIAPRRQTNLITDRTIAYVDTAVSPSHWQTCPQATDQSQETRP